MSNMSYCRFQNTLHDLEDCYENMELHKQSNKEEKEAKEKLIELCKKIVQDYDRVRD